MRQNVSQAAERLAQVSVLTDRTREFPKHFDILLHVVAFLERAQAARPGL